MKANRVDKAINEMLGFGVARAQNSVSIAVNAPQDPAHRVDFISLLENVEVEPGEEAAKVVINSRTGTIVVGQHVRELIDRKSTRLNSSHVAISYAVFCLKKKMKN